MTWLRFSRRPVSGGADACPALPTGEGDASLREQYLLAARTRWLDWYQSQDNVLVPGSGCPQACPCCGHRTLAERGFSEVCRECRWEDDGQDDHDAQVVRGGPNGCLSLEAARQRYVERGGTPQPRR